MELSLTVRGKHGTQPRAQGRSRRRGGKNRKKKDKRMRGNKHRRFFFLGGGGQNLPQGRPPQYFFFHASQDRTDLFDQNTVSPTRKFCGKWWEECAEHVAAKISNAALTTHLRTTCQWASRI
jgi:hypothetical protein